MRLAIRGTCFVLLMVFASSLVSAQIVPDAVTVRDRKDGSTKTHNGLFELTPEGFQIVGTDKKTTTRIHPDDIVKIDIGELPGVDRNAILAARTKEEKKEYDSARVLYQEQLKKPNLPDRSRRFLEFKSVTMTNKIVDELDENKGWSEKADECIKEWMAFLNTEESKFGWEQWLAVRACTRLQAERLKFDDAAGIWSRVSKNGNMPPAAKQDSTLHEIDLQIRGGTYPTALVAAGEQLKTATGTRKDRLTIYEIAAKAGSDGKPLDGIDKIKAVMETTKDPTVHATGFAMMGELYLAGGKLRDAMWMFLWVETVLNHDKDEVFKAMARLHELFQKQMDDDQVRKYQDKLKRARAAF